ncbi:MAG: glycogen-binding domain-containing protein, partial [Deltaproteobacteria bacterium]|nr:glycogen-binding domain-containing protein [Deltaproteobacteria bacterium]
NQWQKDQLPMVDPFGQGSWSAVHKVKQGTYEYMFFVDGKWTPDDHAFGYKDDGFGNQNAVLKIGNGDEKRI